MDGEYEQGVMLVTFAPATSIETAKRELDSIKVVPVRDLSQEDLEDESPIIVQLPDGMSVQDGVRAAQACEHVQAAQPNYIYHLM